MLRIVSFLGTKSDSKCSISLNQGIFFFFSSLAAPGKDFFVLFPIETGAFPSKCCFVALFCVAWSCDCASSVFQWWFRRAAYWFKAEEVLQDSLEGLAAQQSLVLNTFTSLEPPWALQGGKGQQHSYPWICFYFGSFGKGKALKIKKTKH